jgi:hypothetical protein
MELVNTEKHGYNIIHKIVYDEYNKAVITIKCKNVKLLDIIQYCGYYSISAQIIHCKISYINSICSDKFHVRLL